MPMFTGLTRQEQRIILVLIIIITLGLGINYVKEHRDREVVYVDTREDASPDSVSGTKRKQGLDTQDSHGEDNAQGDGQEGPAHTVPGKIDINTATARDLAGLPNIGSVRASSIIRYRESLVAFTSIEQVDDVSGIGEKTMDIIRNNCYVKSPPTPSRKTSKKPGEEATPGDSTSLSQQSLPTPAENNFINLNTATKEELSTLDGIGDALAERIINYRARHGKFGTVEEIKKIDGIGEKKFLQNQHRLCVY